MRRSTIFLAVLMVCALFTNLSPAEAKTKKGNCEEALVTKSFTCDEKYSDGSSDTACYEFETGGVSENFDLFVDNTASDYGCACDTKGSSKSPDFDASSSSFQCVSNFSVAISGSVKKDKLNINGVVGDGNVVIATCVESSTPCF
jgi:hypothetical protein